MGARTYRRHPWEGIDIPGHPQGRIVDVASAAPLWSFSTGSNIVDPPLGYPTTDSVSDFEIPIARDGTYTIVVSQPEDRPANATVENGVAWLKGADPTLPDLVIMRHMIPAKSFVDQSIWAVPELTPGVAAGIMDPGFPGDRVQRQGDLRSRRRDRLLRGGQTRWFDSLAAGGYWEEAAHSANGQNVIEWNRPGASASRAPGHGAS